MATLLIAEYRVGQRVLLLSDDVEYGCADLGSGASTGCAPNRQTLARPIDCYATARYQSVRSDLSLRGRPRPSEN